MQPLLSLLESLKAIVSNLYLVAFSIIDSSKPEYQSVQPIILCPEPSVNRSASGDPSPRGDPPGVSSIAEGDRLWGAIPPLTKILLASAFP